MKIRRPAFLFLCAEIIGILIATGFVSKLFLLILLTIAIFLYGKLFFEGKLYIRTIIVILVIGAISFIRFKYVEKNTSLGHFIAMVGGFSLGADGRKWEVMEEEERRLITPKFKEYDNMRSMFDRDYYQDNTYEVCDILAEKSGVFYFIYNGIGAYNDPFAVISHPLDDEVKIKKYLDDCIDLSRSQNE